MAAASLVMRGKCSGSAQHTQARLRVLPVLVALCGHLMAVKAAMEAARTVANGARLRSCPPHSLHRRWLSHMCGSVCAHGRRSWM